MFANRRDAGRRLADRLAPQAEDDPVVVGLPRGGVAVAAEVAERLAAPLDVLVARKLGCPWQPELGIGAVAEGNVRVLNERLVLETGIDAAALESVTRRELEELARRVVRYRGGRDPVPVADRTVIVVDDGLATGGTARAAIEALRSRRARRVVLAVPVAPEETVAAMRRIADQVVAVETPAWFMAIGEFYEDFAQVPDEVVVALLEQAAVRISRAGRDATPTP